MARWINQGPGVSSARLFTMLILANCQFLLRDLHGTEHALSMLTIVLLQMILYNASTFAMSSVFHGMRRDLFHMGLQTSQLCCWIEANSCLRGLHGCGHHFASIVHGGVHKYCAPYG